MKLGYLDKESFEDLVEDPNEVWRTSDAGETARLNGGTYVHALRKHLEPMVRPGLIVDDTARRPRGKAQEEPSDGEAEAGHPPLLACRPEELLELDRSHGPFLLPPLRHSRSSDRLSLHRSGIGKPCPWSPLSFRLRRDRTGLPPRPVLLSTLEVHPFSPHSMMSTKATKENCSFRSTAEESLLL